MVRVCGESVERKARSPWITYWSKTFCIVWIKVFRRPVQALVPTWTGRHSLWSNGDRNSSPCLHTDFSFPALLFMSYKLFLDWIRKIGWRKNKLGEKRKRKECQTRSFGTANASLVCQSKPDLYLRIGFFLVWEHIVGHYHLGYYFDHFSVLVLGSVERRV